MRNRPAFIRQSNEPRPVVNPSFSVTAGDWILSGGKFRQVSAVINAGTEQEWYILTNGREHRARVEKASDFEFGPLSPEKEPA